RNGINSGKGLIQQNEIRRDAQAACDLHPAPLAPRKRITPVLPNHSETQLLDQSLHSLAALVPRNILGFEHSQDVVLDRQLAKDRRLLRQVTDSVVPRPQIHRDISDVLVIDQDSPGIGLDQSDDDIKAGGFTGAVRAEQADHFTLPYVQADIVDYPSPAVAFADLIRR